MLIPYPSLKKSYSSLCQIEYIFLSLPFQIPTMWLHLYFLQLLTGVLDSNPQTPTKQRYLVGSDQVFT